MTAIIKKVVKYANDNAAGLALLSSGFIGISTFLYKFLIFCYTKGQLNYWGINSSVIEVFSNNFIFEIMFAAIFFASYIIVSLLFSIPLHYKSKGKNKHFLIKIGLLIPIYLLAVSLYGCLLFFSPGIKIIWFLPALNLFCTILASMIRWTVFNKTSTSKPGMSAIICNSIFLVFFLSVIASSFYFLGKNFSQNQVSFSILNDDKVILYETSSNYFTANCTIRGNSIIIFPKHQGIYERQNNNIEIRTFSSVVTQE